MVEAKPELLAQGATSSGTTGSMGAGEPNGSSTSGAATAGTAAPAVAPEVPAPSNSGAVATAESGGSVTAESSAPASAKEPETGPVPEGEVSEETHRAGAAEGKRNGKSKNDKDENLPIWERSPKVKVSGYVYSAFYINDAVGVPDNEFRIRNARIQLGWEQGTLLDGVVEVELSKEEDKDTSSWSPLRDAYARVAPFKELRFRMGQFKRPFGRIALTSHRDLRLIDRGVSYAWVSKELDYGDRDVGLQLEGSWGKRYAVEYMFGVFNGTGRNAREIDPKGAKDFVGRIEGHLGKHVSIAASVSNKRWDNPPQVVSYTADAWMWGADFAVDYRGFYGMVEAAYGDNFSTFDVDKTWYVLGLIAQRIPVAQTWNLAIEPLLKGELLTPDANISDSRVMVGTLGANLHLGNVFRLMVQGEVIHPTKEDRLPSNLGEGETMKRLVVQAALHTK
jgi:hypothetical protein